MKANSIQIALCHLLFNIIGILIWFPAPPMRRVIINAACTLGFYASYWRLVPLIYILVMFLAVPGITLAISLLYQASIAGGVVVTILALGLLAAFVVWWVPWISGPILSIHNIHNYYSNVGLYICIYTCSCLPINAGTRYSITCVYCLLAFMPRSEWAATRW